ncbi:hypothetical protein Gorai_018705, partial [Gossypium raimondii]|nr:hypothetical protein [Gossypium raimondii]
MKKYYKVVSRDPVRSGTIEVSFGQMNSPLKGPTSPNKLSNYKRIYGIYFHLLISFRFWIGCVEEWKLEKLPPSGILLT